MCRCGATGACDATVSLAEFSRQPGAKKRPPEPRSPRGAKDSSISGSDWSVSGCASLRALSASSHVFVEALRRPPCQRHAPRSAETHPRARSRCGLATWPHQVSDLGQPQIRGIASLGTSLRTTMGGKICHLPKAVKVDFFSYKNERTSNKVRPMRRQQGKVRGTPAGQNVAPMRRSRGQGIAVTLCPPVAWPKNRSLVCDQFHEPGFRAFFQGN